MEKLTLTLGKLEQRLRRLDFDMDAVADYVILMTGDDRDDASNTQTSAIMIRQFWGQIRDNQEEFFRSIRRKLQNRPPRLLESIQQAFLAVQHA